MQIQNKEHSKDKDVDEMCVDDKDYKEDKHYTNKFIKRSKIKRGFKKIYTNCYSNTGSRPCHPNGIMQYNRMVNNDIVHYQAIDYIPNNDAYRKTAAPMIVSILYNKIKNKQNHNTNIQKLPIDNNDDNDIKISHLVYLPLISKNLYLSDFKTILNNQNFLVNDKKINVVINLGLKPLSRGLFKRVFNIGLRDSRTTSYKTFMLIVKQVIDIINEGIEYKDRMVICCDKAVNRSVSMIISYNLMNPESTLKTLEETINYIIKKKNDNSWPILNNLKFYHYLQIIEQNNKNNCKVNL